MWRNLVRLVFVLAALTASCQGDLAAATTKLVVSRSIDISTQIAKYILNIEIKNEGTEGNFFIHPFTNAEYDHLAYVTANDGTSKKLTVSKTTYPSGKNGYIYYKVDLGAPINKGSSQKIRLEYVLTQLLEAYPAEITQAETQFMKWTGSSHYISVYQVESDSTNVKVGNGKVVSHSGKHSGDKVQFGPAQNIQPFTEKPTFIHYENNAAFVVVTSLERTIEVSMWGNIAIEDHIEVVHKGAELKGSFSRLDYQVDRRSKTPIVKVLKAILPTSARDIYYRDQIGNISTSTVRGYKDRVEVELRPRFPLLGGWKTNYILGYNVPSAEFLYSSGGNYALKLPLIHPTFNDMVVEHATVKIILPETAHNIKVVKPYQVTQLPDTLHFTYLDVVGRPVLTFTKNNLVEYHSSSPFTIYYDFNYISILREPIIALLAFLAVFVVVIIINRFDFSIAPARADHQKTE